MSAIYGILGDASMAEVRLMGTRLLHRGRDGGEWSVSGSVRFGERAHERGGRGWTPPSCPIAFDGRVDNREQLASLVGWRPESPASCEGGALVFEVLRKFGPEGLSHVSGQFSLAFWDDERHRLILARDVWGSRPLYYARVSDRYAFASEYKALLALDDMIATPNRDAIQFVQNTKHPMPTASCLEGVSPVPGGSWVEIGDGRAAAHRFFNLNTRAERRSIDEHACDLRSAILEATRRQLSGYDAVGVSLSGGMDSAMTLAAIRRVAPEKTVHAFTAGNGPDDHEIQGASIVAERLGAVHHHILFDAQNLATLMPALVWHMEDPIGREERIVHFATAREAAKHVDVLFAGHGADSLFGGMPRHRLVKAATKFRLGRRPLEELFAYSQTGAQPRTLLGRALVHVYYRGRHVAPPNVAGASPASSSAGFPLDSVDPLSAVLRQGIMDDAPANSSIERLYAASGLEYSSLFMDTSVTQYAFGLPDALKIRGWTQKYILRRAGAELLPEDILKRKKSLTRLRHDAVVSDVLDDLAQNLLAPEAVHSRGLFEPAYVAGIRRRPAHSAYSSEQLYRLWSLILTEIWCRQFLDDRGRMPESLQETGTAYDRTLAPSMG